MFVNYLRYHRMRLTPEEQVAYDAAERAIFRWEPQFVVDASMAYADPYLIWWKIMVAVYNDNPSYYYFTPTEYSVHAGKRDFGVNLRYLYPVQEAKGLEHVLAEFLKNFYRAHVTPNTTDAEKVRMIHQFLVTRVTYATEELVTNSDLDVFNVLGALLKRRAVCHGIAMAFKLLCDYLKVPCIVVPGDARIGDGHTEKHAWNIVRLDGDFYHVDATWDLRTKGLEEMVYNYYNIDDATIGVDHDWDRAFYPHCNGYRHNFFYATKAFASRPEQLGVFYSRVLAKGGRRSVLKYRGSMPSDEVIEGEVGKAVRAHIDSHGVPSMRYGVHVDRNLKNIFAQFEE